MSGGRDPRRFRQRPRRTVKKTILVVTEGIKTEVQYLQGLRQHLRDLNLDVFGVETVGVGKDPMHVFREAKRRYTMADEDYDSVWILVDRDEHATLDECLRAARSEGYSVLVSNPNFEVWLVWHYQDHTSYATPTDLRRKLSTLGHPTKDIPARFPFAAVSEAYERARRLGIPCACECGENPSSGVPHLVQVLGGGAP